MRHLIILENASRDTERAQFSLRAGVCRQCPARPAGSESLGPDVPRACEKDCQLFVQLPRLLHAAHCIDPMVGSFQRIMKGHLERIAQPLDGSAGRIGTASSRRHPWAGRIQQTIGILKNLVGR